MDNKRQRVLGDVEHTGGAEFRGSRKKGICSRSEMSIRSKIFDRGLDGSPVVTGVGGFSVKDPRPNAGSGRGLCCGSVWDCDGDVAHDGTAAEVVARSKVRGLNSGLGSPFPVRSRAREVDDSKGVTAGESLRTDGPGCRDGERRPSVFRWKRSCF